MMQNGYVNEPIRGIACRKFFFLVLVLSLALVCRAQERKYFYILLFSVPHCLKSCRDF